MRTVALTKESTKDILENLLKRSPNNYGKFEAAVDEILNKVKTEGDAALFAYTKEFDKTEISADTIKVTEEEIKEAYEAVDPALIDVIRKALVNIRSYHEKQRQNSWFTSETNGTMLGTESNCTCTCWCLRSGRKGCLSFFRTDEHRSCQSSWSRPDRYDNSSGKRR